jgi:DHA1 family bicyclomycin/chloramphenicol resistance-like MFS transporter
LICGRVLALIGATALMLWFFVGGVGVWAMFLPIAFTEIGDGMSQPSTMAAGLSIHSRLAGTASGLMGFLQMAMAASGSFIVALLPQDSAFGPISVFAGFVVLALAFGLFAVRRQWSSALPLVCPMA